MLDRAAFVPDELTTKALDVLDDLNGWDREMLDVVECPDRHPNVRDTGETGGFISMRQKELAGLGFTARWNRGKRVFELHPLTSGSNPPGERP